MNKGERNIVCGEREVIPCTAGKKRQNPVSFAMRTRKGKSGKYKPTGAALLPLQLLSPTAVVRQAARKGGKEIEILAFLLRYVSVCACERACACVLSLGDP